MLGRRGALYTVVCIPRQTHLTPSTCEPDPQSFPLMAAEPWCVHIHQQKKKIIAAIILFGVWVCFVVFFFLST